MRPLRHDRVRGALRRVLDVESTGLGTPVPQRSLLARPPRPVLTVVYDGTAYRRRWGPGSILASLAELVGETEGGRDVDVWGHFAGSFDFRLALREFLLEYRVRWRFTRRGALPIMIEGRPLGEGAFRLLDSIAVLPGRLAEIGRAVGVEKLDWDHGWHGDRDYAGGPTRGRRERHRLHAPICYEALARYCERDCLVLWTGIAEIERHARSRGVELRATIASTATASIRKGLTEETVAWAPPEVDAVSARAAVGARCELYRESFEPSPARPVLYWHDLQSSYSRAMREVMPWRYLETRDDWRGEELAIVECEVEVPPCYLPALPYRSELASETGRLYFPTGCWRGVFAGYELLYACEQNLARVREVAACHLFEGSTVLREFAESRWEERRVAEGFRRYALKIESNAAGYGKTVESIEKDELVVRPPTSQYLCERHRGETARRPDERCGCKVPLSRELGLYQFSYAREPAFRAPWVGASILAIGRVRVHHAMVRTLELGGRLYYCDTDCDPTDVALLTEKGELGALALEREVSAARFYAPKLYWLRCERCSAKDRDGEPLEHPHDHVRGKGLPGLDRAALEALVRCPECGGAGWRAGTAFGCPRCGGSLLAPGRGRAGYRFERSEGLGEALRRRESVGYRRLVVERALRETRPKRGDGGARPWTVGELRQRWLA